MKRASLFGSALLLSSTAAAAQPAQPGPPERIVLPVIQPDCDRTGEGEVVVCGRSDRRFRIDSGTLSTLRAIEQQDDPAKRPRPRAITNDCAGMGPMVSCTGNIPISDMALKAIGLIIKAARGEDLRPALRQGPTDYELYERAKAKAEAKKK